MQERSGEYYEDREMESNVKRYETMKSSGIFSYFDVDEILDIINYYIENSKIIRASEACKSALLIHPTSAELKLKNAQLFIGKGEPNEALLWLNKVKEFSKWNQEYLLTKGMAMSLLNLMDEAKTYFTRALNLVSGTEKEDVLFNIANSLEKGNSAETAIYYYNLGCEINPKNEEIYFRLGLCYNRLGHEEESISSYNRYIEINPFSENVWFNLGIVLNSAERYKEAIDAYDYAIALENNHFDALFNKANAQANNEEYKEAIVSYKDYLDIFNNNITARYYIGECQMQLKEHQQALDSFDSILIEDISFAEAFYGKAMVYEDMNKPDEAIKNYKKAIEIDSDNTDAWFSIGNLHIQSENFTEAVVALNNTLSINKFDIEAWLLNAEAYDKLGDTSKSINQLCEAMEHMPENSDIIYALSAYYLKSGNNKLGLKWFEDALAIEKDNYELVLKIYPEGKDLIEEILNKN